VLPIRPPAARWRMTFAFRPASAKTNLVTSGCPSFSAHEMDVRVTMSGFSAAERRQGPTPAVLGLTTWNPRILEGSGEYGLADEETYRR